MSCVPTFMWVVLLSRQLLLTFAARVGTHSQIDSAVTTNASIAFSSLHVSGFEGSLDSPVKRYPSELQAKYPLTTQLSCGYQGCAYLAKRAGSSEEVVVKINNCRGDSMVEECSLLNWVRYRSCDNGGSDEILRLQEAHLPHCYESGNRRKQGGYCFMVMPLAGMKQMRKLEREVKEAPLSPEMGKRYFAQLVASFYTLHGIGLWHNDAHSGNLMLDKNGQVSLIDFGLLVGEGCTTNRCRTGFSRDGNAIYRVAAILANCPADAQWPYGEYAFWLKAAVLRKAQERALQCFRDNWKADDEFISVMQQVFNANVWKSRDQFVERLWRTTLIQKSYPKLSGTYHVAGTEDCQTWSREKLLQEMLKNQAEPPFEYSLEKSGQSQGNFSDAELHAGVKIMQAGKCLQVYSPGGDADWSNSRNVVVAKCHGRARNEDWLISKDGEIKSAVSGLCLDVEYDKCPVVKGTNIILYECNGQNNQKWWLKGSWNMSVVSKKILCNKCLDVHIGSGTDMQNVVLFDCKSKLFGNENQKWVLG